MAKKLKWAALILCGAIALFCYFYIPNPLRITNPYHPWFNPRKFHFEDYTASECMMREALAKILPRGISQQFVEEVLVKSGKARVNRESDGLKVHYIRNPVTWMDIFPVGKIWNVTVTYSSDHKVIDITLPAGPQRSAYDYQVFCKFGKRYAYGRKWK